MGQIDLDMTLKLFGIKLAQFQNVNLGITVSFSQLLQITLLKLRIMSAVEVFI